MYVHRTKTGGTKTILDLPPHVLIHAFLQLEDIPSRLNVESTCHEIRGLMTHVWQTLCLSKYDHPRRAAAFLTPRAEIDWKRRYIDREWTIRFLEQGWPLEGNDFFTDKHTESELSKAAPRVCRTIIDLFLDLPPRDEVSLNLPIIVSLLQIQALMIICQAASIPDADYLEALFYCLPMFREELPPSYDVYPKHRWIRPSLDLPCRSWPWDPASKWINEAKAALRIHPHNQLPYLETRRGPALSLMSGRPPSLPSDEIWDWAGVGGTWFGSATVPPPALRNRPVNHEKTRTQHFEGLHLSVVATGAEVAQAYSQLFTTPNLDTLWADFDELDDLDSDTDPSHPLQPLIFHGICRDTGMFVGYDEVRQRWGLPRGQVTSTAAPRAPRTPTQPTLQPKPNPDQTAALAADQSPGDKAQQESRTQERSPDSSTEPPTGCREQGRTPLSGVYVFVHGIARLVVDSPDSPPQVRYTMSFTFWGQTKRIVLRGLQPWGPDSGGGVLGAYTHGGYDPAYPMGYMWLWNENSQGVSMAGE